MTSAVSSADDKIAEAARAWVIARAEEEVTAETEAAFQDWLQADRRHRAMYAQVYGIWGAAAQMGHLQGDKIQDDQTAAPTSRRRFLWAGAVAAGIAALAAGFSFIAPSSSPGVIATQTAEIRNVPLEDGSLVTLGAESAMSVDFTDTERRVSLASGEAFFEVEKDAARPFIVSVGKTEVRVVGTKFDVRRGVLGVDVAVLEGVVEVIRTQAADKRILTAGEKLVTTPGALTEIPATKGHAPGAWRQGRLVFDNAPLAEVLADADRYYAGDIILASDEVGRLRVTASYKTDAIEQMLQSLEQVLPIKAERNARGDLVISAAEAG